MQPLFFLNFYFNNLFNKLLEEKLILGPLLLQFMYCGKNTRGGIFSNIIFSCFCICFFPFIALLLYLRLFSSFWTCKSSRLRRFWALWISLDHMWTLCWTYQAFFRMQESDIVPSPGSYPTANSWTSKGNLWIQLQMNATHYSVVISQKEENDAAAAPVSCCLDLACISFGQFINISLAINKVGYANMLITWS